MDRESIITQLRKRCAAAPSRAAVARELGVSSAYLSDVLAGRRGLGAKLLAALGIKRRTVYEQGEIPR